MWRGLATSQRDIVAKKNVDGSARVKHRKISSAYMYHSCITRSLIRAIAAMLLLDGTAFEIVHVAK